MSELFVVSPDGEGGYWSVCEMSNDAANADADLIVRAVNSYEAADQLAEVVHKVARGLRPGEMGVVQREARVALAAFQKARMT